jgi:glycosyltransferase involved in cell wall biosynthesis
MNTAARISVVIPAYNAERTLCDAVATARAQTHPPFEIIVVDDASTDRTAEVAQSVSGSDLIVLRCTRNAGGAAARNQGAAYASGDYIAFLDADDLWSTTKLAAQLAALAGAEKNAFCFCAVYRTNEYDERHVIPRRAPHARESLADYVLRDGNVIQTSGLLIPREAANACRFTEKLRRFQDIDFVLQLDSHGHRAVFLSEPLVEWRNVAASRVSSNPDPRIIGTFFQRHGASLNRAQRLGLEIRSLGPGSLGALTWLYKLALSICVGALALPNAASLFLKHVLGLRLYRSIRSLRGAR